MNEELNYLQDLEISLDNIHEIVDTHSVTSMRYHELYADKLDEYNEQKRKVQIEKAELQEVYAKIYLQTIKLPKKMTEKEKDSIVITHQDYKNKQTKYFDEIKTLNDLEKECNVLEGVVKNMQARKNMIEVKRDLFQLGFYSEPRQNTTNRINEKLNK